MAACKNHPLKRGSKIISIIEIFLHLGHRTFAYLEQHISVDKLRPENYY